VKIETTQEANWKDSVISREEYYTLSLNQLKAHALRVANHNVAQ
jgi:hypothetical protein